MLLSPLWGIKIATAIDLKSIEPHRSHLNHFPFIEGEVFVVGDVAELVAEAVGGADGFVDVAVGVAVDPVVDSAGGDVVGQLDGECAVDAATLELGSDQLIGWDVVGDDDLVLGVAGADGLLDEVEATLMLAVEIGVPQQVLTIDDAVKVGNASLGDEGVVHVNMRPQGGYDEVHILDRDDLVIVVMDVGADFANQSVLHRLQVVVLIKLVVAQSDQHLLKAFGRPVPKRVHAVHVVPQVTCVASQDQNIALHIHGAIVSQVPPVVAELQVQIRCELYFHDSIML